MGFRCTGCPCVATPATPAATASPHLVTSWSYETLFYFREWNGNVVFSGGAAPVAGSVLYVPMILGMTLAPTLGEWANGSGITAGSHTDVGVYSSSGGIPAARLTATGSVANAGVDTRQTSALAPAAALSVGVLYFLALASDSATTQYYRVTSVSSDYFLDMPACFEETTFPLPANATPTVATAWQTLPLYGVGDVAL